MFWMLGWYRQSRQVTLTLTQHAPETSSAHCLPIVNNLGTDMIEMAQSHGDKRKPQGTWEPEFCILAVLEDGRKSLKQLHACHVTSVATDWPSSSSDRFRPCFVSKSGRQCQSVIISSCQTRQGLKAPDPPLYQVAAFPSRGTKGC